MSLSSKILILIGFLAFLGISGLIVYKQFEVSARQDAIEKQVVAQTELANGITRAMAAYATKEDINNIAKENNVNMKIIQDNLDKLNASVTAINVVTTSSKPQVGTSVPSTGTQPGANPPPVALTYPDPHGYQQKTQTLKLDEKFATTAGPDATVPLAEVGFSAWQEKPWNYTVPKRDYKVTTVLGTDENQRQYAYNKFSITTDGKEQEVKIANSTFTQEYPEAKFRFFNPRLYLGVDVGANIATIKPEVTPNVSLQIMSYGRYATQPDLSVLQVGVGYGLDAKKPSVSVTPIMYNVGKHIPLMNNLYVGPALQVNTSGDVGIMGGIKVGL